MKVDTINYPANKEALIQKIESCDNPYLLFQIEKLLDRKNTVAPIGKLVGEYPWLIKEGVPRDMEVRTKLEPPIHSTIARYDSKMAPYLYYIGLFMLVLAAALINLMSNEGENIGVALFQSKVALIFGLLWIVFLVDFLIVYFLYLKSESKPPKITLYLRAFVLLFPPLRIGAQHLEDPSLQWIPFMGWSFRNEGLLKDVKEKFSIPMIVIALLIIPVLVIEWKFYEPLEAFLKTDLSFVLDMTQAFIWLAFAFEFIMMITISREKMAYAQRNWIDLLIIFLPFIAFIRTMRVIKIARLSHLSRGYKLRGLFMKARQGLLLAGFLYKIVSLKEFQIKSLKKKLDDNRKEREIIEEELVTLYQTAKKKNKKMWRKSTSQSK
ncbi:hypothetical protein [Rhodonellum sp.]|uniref:hypothetical protein n=1 Tax=Rhodonellum sp. TaxID=2231180 RepID=UPI00272853F4|nr:hypothetical protein [Rhodonellum sp.]MDO9554509.1 hypothetical protein [Rhodonellum sp.]